MNKGFTLVEVLAVITIISLLLLLITPPIINRINTKYKDVNSIQEKMFKDAAAIYFDEHPNETCVDVETLENEGKLEKSYINEKGKATDKLNIRISKDDSNNYEIKPGTCG